MRPRPNFEPPTGIGLGGFCAQALSIRRRRKARYACGHGLRARGAQRARLLLFWAAARTEPRRPPDDR